MTEIDLSPQEAKKKFIVLDQTQVRLLKEVDDLKDSLKILYGKLESLGREKDTLIVEFGEWVSNYPEENQ